MSNRSAAPRSAAPRFPRLAMRPCAAAVLLLAGIALPAAAQQKAMRIIVGSVTDSGGNFIPYVTLKAGREYGALTDIHGQFRMVLPQDVFVKLDVRRIGFMPAHVEFAGGEDTTLVIRLAGLALPLATQRIEVARVRTLEHRGFYARMAERQEGINSGEFISPEEIEQRNASRPTQLLESRHGVLVRRVGTCNILVQCWVPRGPDGCYATVYLDGIRLNRLGDATMYATPVYLDDLINPSTIAGIEIYARGVEAPPQYQFLNGNCAIILIWTR
jgi:hypothetical protein